MCQGAGIAGGIQGAVGNSVKTYQVQHDAEQTKKAARRQFERTQVEIARILESDAELTAEQNFELARRAAVARGRAQNSGLGERSVAALARAVNFQFGQDVATGKKNLEQKRTDARVKLSEAHAKRNAIYESVGDTSGVRIALMSLATVGETLGGIFGGLNAANNPNDSGAGTSTTAANVTSEGTGAQPFGDGLQIPTSSGVGGQNEAGGRFDFNAFSLT